MEQYSKKTIKNQNFQIWKRPTKVLKSQTGVALKSLIFRLMFFIKNLKLILACDPRCLDVTRVAQA